MLAQVAAGKADPGQLVIYPQAPASPWGKPPYKIGTAALYADLGQPCVPVAANVGLFWPKRGILRRPGTAVNRVPGPDPPGLDTAAFMARMETAIETASDRLMAEAGFTGGQP